MNAASIAAWLREHAQGAGDLCLDSRQLRAGDVFFACPGLASDGRQYLRQAVDAGAAAVVMERHAGDTAFEAPVSDALPVLEVTNLRSMLGEVAHEWYGRPSEAMSVVAVTGTNGKTSTVQWLAAALNAQGIACGTVGTLGVTLPEGDNLGGALTTPDVLTMHRSLGALRDAGTRVVALEASSIGLDQGRLDGVHIEVAGFTNLTHDHLDYHRTVDAYREAKMSLFRWPGLRAAVVNADDGVGRDIMNGFTDVPVLSYSIEAGQRCAIEARDIQTGTYGLVFNLVLPSGTAQILTRLVGRHNIANLLLLAGVLHYYGWDITRIAATVATLEPVPGRLQVVQPDGADAAARSHAMVVVDYAHTPDALERALEAMREVAAARAGRLVCVFGCGGGRDSRKRPVMGGIAARLADRVIVTTDNPRGEDPQSIVDQIVAGMDAAPQVVLDRAQAILRAIWSAQENDVVLLAGKGHETYQEANGLRTAFDDRQWARFALTWQLARPAVSTDSRSVAAGQLFIAIKGDTFDGHDYLAQVCQAGAAAAIVARADAAVPMTQFVLGDTRAALIRIATAWRTLFDLPVIAVTGSNGKTTTKEMIASILVAWRGGEAVLATQGNMNNDLGAPLMVLRLTRAHKVAVFELGMNHPGEIAVLASVVQPTIALVNNAQREHQEFMHTVEAVARENGSVLQALPADGVAVFPGDDAYAALWRDMSGARKQVRFGFDTAYGVHARDIAAEPERTRFTLATASGGDTVVLNVPGLHNLRNALAAASCALAAGAPLAAVARGLAGFNPVAGRMKPVRLGAGLRLIDDTYNANPDSVRAAVDVLATLRGKTVLVLGDMAEVGDDSAAMHAEAGSYARAAGIDALLVFGAQARHAAQAFGPGAQAFDAIGDLVDGLVALAPANILVKGSRSTRMERVVRGFQEKMQEQDQGGGHAA
jgi:murE/murF fusion protein